MKKKKEQQNYFRVSDFESAIKRMNYRSQISIINYIPDSLFVKELTGFVECNNRGIRVSWNHQGEATVAGERTPEFDLNL